MGKWRRPGTLVPPSCLKRSIARQDFCSDLPDDPRPLGPIRMSISLAAGLPLARNRAHPTMPPEFETRGRGRVELRFLRDGNR